MANNYEIKNEILSQLSPNIVSTIKSIFIFKGNGIQSIFITNDDKVYILRDNSSGYSGLGETDKSKSLELIDELCGKKFCKFDFCSNGFIVGLTNCGELYQWGYYNFKYWRPILIEPMRPFRCVDMYCGIHNTIVLTQSGDVYSVTSDQSLKFKVKRLTEFNNEKIESISGGNNHFLATTKSGKVFGWGRNTSGQLGLANNAPVVSLCTEIKIFNKFVVKKISCGLKHSLVLTNEGNIYSFGSNNFGQLGIGSTLDRNKPLLIFNSHKFVDILANNRSNISIALSDKGLAYVWGECSEGITNYPKRTQFTTFQEVITYYSKELFTDKLIGFNELFLSPTPQTLSVSTIMSTGFDDPIGSDLKFKIKSNNKLKYIYVNKWFIEEKSKHFQTMFANEWFECNANEIEIKEHSYEAYYAFLRFLYSDCIKLEDIDVLLELLDIANEYLDERLEEMCTQCAERLTTVENVCDVYSVALLYNCIDLENFCFIFMTNITSKLTKTDAYERMDLIYVKHFNTKFVEYFSFQ